MLQLTPSTISYPSTLLSTTVPSAEATVRMFRGTSGELQLRADSPSPDDVAFEYQGRPVLILDKQLSEMLKDCVLDVVQSPQGQTLTLRG